MDGILYICTKIKGFHLSSYLINIKIIIRQSSVNNKGNSKFFELKLMWLLKMNQLIHHWYTPTVQRICFLNLPIYKERPQKIETKASLVQCGNQASCMDFVLNVLVSSWAQTKLAPYEDTTNFCALFQCIQGI